MVARRNRTLRHGDTPPIVIVEPLIDQPTGPAAGQDDALNILSRSEYAAH